MPATVTHLPDIQPDPAPPSLADCAAALTGIGYRPSDAAAVAAPLSWSPAMVSALEAAMRAIGQAAESDPVAFARSWEAQSR